MKGIAVQDRSPELLYLSTRGIRAIDAKHALV